MGFEIERLSVPHGHQLPQLPSIIYPHGQPAGPRPRLGLPLVGSGSLGELFNKFFPLGGMFMKPGIFLGHGGAAQNQQHQTAQAAGILFFHA